MMYQQTVHDFRQFNKGNQIVFDDEYLVSIRTNQQRGYQFISYQSVEQFMSVYGLTLGPNRWLDFCVYLVARSITLRDKERIEWFRIQAREGRNQMRTIYES